MPEASAFEYTVLRVVPRVEREEFVNAGVLLFSRSRRFLACRIELDEARLRALAPAIDLPAVRAQLELIPQVCAGGPAAGPIGEMDQAERFRWLAAPRSTVIQTSPVHSGLCDEPQQALDDLFAKLVARPAADP